MTLRIFTALLVALLIVACGDGTAPAPANPPSVFLPNRLDGIPEPARPILAKSLEWIGGLDAFAGVEAVTTSMRASREAGSVLHECTVDAEGSLVMIRRGEPNRFTETMGANGGVGWMVRNGRPEAILVDADEVRRRATIVQSLNALGPVLGAEWLHGEVLEPRTIGSIECDAVRLHGAAGLLCEFACERATGRPMTLSFSVPTESGPRMTESRWLQWDTGDGRRWPTIIDTRSNQGAVGLMVLSADFLTAPTSATALPPEVVALVTAGEPISRMDPPPPAPGPAIPAVPADERPADRP
jgi:hypothetical protein